MPDLLVSTVIPIVRNVLLILSAPNVRVLLKNLMLLVSVSIVRSTSANFVDSLVNVLLVLMDILRVMDCVSFVMWLIVSAVQLMINAINVLKVIPWMVLNVRLLAMWPDVLNVVQRMSVLIVMLLLISMELLILFSFKVIIVMPAFHNVRYVQLTCSVLSAKSVTLHWNLVLTEYAIPVLTLTVWPAVMLIYARNVWTICIHSTLRLVNVRLQNATYQTVRLASTIRSQIQSSVQDAWQVFQQIVQEHV